MGLADVYVGIEIDLVKIIGIEISGGVVWDTDTPSESGLFGTIGPAIGDNIGASVGAGFALRDIEGVGPINGDINVGKVSGQVTSDEKGPQGGGLSYGPGAGASLSRTDTGTVTFKEIKEWFKEKFSGPGKQ